MTEHTSFAGILAGLVLMILSSVPVSADWVHLKNGSKLQGKVVKTEEGWVHIRLPDGNMKVRSSRVERIERQQEEAYRLDQAEKHRAYGNYEKAIEQIRGVLERSTDSRSARQELKQTYLEAARTWFQEKKVFRSRKLLRRATSEFPDAVKLHSLLTEVEAYERKVRETLAKAKSYHRKKQYTEAIDRYEEVVDRLPEITEEIGVRLADVYWKAGRQQYRKGDLTSAIAYFEQAIRYEPERMEQAKPYWIRSIQKRTNVLIKKEKYAAAEDLLSTQTQNFPANKRLKFLHAYSMHLQGDLERAIEQYSSLLNRNVSEPSPDITKLQKKAAKASDVQLRSPGSKRYETVLPGDWRTVQTEHFTIYHRNKKLANRAEKMVERYLEQMKKEVNLPELDWSQRCEIYIYPDRKSYDQNANLPSWSAGETQVDKGGGVLQSHRILTYQTVPQLFESVLPHEIAHVLFYRMMNYRNLPLWLKEGVAVYFEYPAKKKHYLMRVRAAYDRGHLIPLDEMIGTLDYPEQEEEKDHFYAQSYSLVQFLLQHGGWSALVNFGKTFSRSEPAEALEEVYGFSSLKEFKRAWIRYIESD